MTVGSMSFYLICFGGVYSCVSSAYCSHILSMGIINTQKDVVDDGLYKKIFGYIGKEEPDLSCFFIKTRSQLIGGAGKTSLR